MLETARRNGIPIIQSPFIIDKNNRNTYKKIPFLPKYLGQFVAGTWRAEYTDGINKESDYEVKGRTAFDNTVNSNLIDILKTINAKTIYLMGFTTDHCVAETMDSLIKLGYNAIFVNDATATIFESTQLKMEKKYPNIISTKLIEKFNEGPH